MLHIEYSNVPIITFLAGIICLHYVTLWLQEERH